MDIEYTDRDRNPVDADTWFKLVSDLDYVRVGYWVRDDVTVSTVWLWGTDGMSIVHFDPDRRYETMICGADGHEHRIHYPSRETALEGHALIVDALEKLSDALKEPLTEDVGDV